MNIKQNTKRGCDDVKRKCMYIPQSVFGPFVSRCFQIYGPGVNNDVFNLLSVISDGWVSFYDSDRCGTEELAATDSMVFVQHSLYGLYSHYMYCIFYVGSLISWAHKFCKTWLSFIVQSLDVCLTNASHFFVFGW